MSLETNKNVDKLAGYLPFDADTSQLFQEYVDPTSEVLDTAAFDYLLEAIGRPDSRLVVLTGDAGHGKTHLCFRLLVAQGIAEVDAQAMILKDSDGSTDLGSVGAGKALRLIKDLSDFTAEDAAALMESALLAEQRVTVVCANEGRLRRAIQERPGSLGILRETLEAGTRLGLTTIDQVSYVLNLNFQSVASQDRPGIAEQLLKSWVQDQRRWRICGVCDAQEICPIYENHRTLGASTESAERRRRFVELLRLVERCGTVVTIRELFIVTSLAVTGGLRCEDVHRRFERSHRGREWQYPFLYHQALFGESIGERDRNRLRLLRSVRRIDPASVSIRSVDDDLSAVEGDREGRFLPPVPTVEQAAARSRSQFQRDAASQRRLMGFLRRRSFFNDGSSTDHLRGTGARTGLRHASLFEAVVNGSLTEQETVALRDDIVTGLEAIQGVRRPPQANLFIVDPAFTSHRSSASVVAQQLPASRVDFVSQRAHWTSSDGAAPELSAALDWTDRAIFVRISQGRELPLVTLELDMLRFELLLRYAEGLTAREHFHADLRRITSTLAKLATATDATEITVLVGGERRRLSIDVGNRVRAVDA